MTPELYDFLKSWYEWATGEAVDRRPFFTQYGLCTNARFHNDEDYGDGGNYILASEFRIFVHAELGDAMYPFGQDDYDYCHQNSTQHLHEPRLEWVRSRIAEHEEKHGVT